MVDIATKVIDASADRGRSCSVSRQRETVARRLDGRQLVAPPLLDFEMGNVCLTASCVVTPDRRDELLAGFRWRSRLAIQIRNVDHEAFLHLAEQTGSAFYDASYLMWLGRSEVETGNT